MLPTVAIARTVKGRGVPSIERTQLHCGQLDPVEYRNAIEELRQ
jgi:hypothetical protein